MITIVIINWNAGDLLFSCVNSIVKYHSDLVSNVVVVDNASSDDSILQLKNIKLFPFKFEIVQNIKNIGFGAACNQGAEVGDSKYILFLNPDAQLFENSLTIPYTFMQSPENKQVGISGVQLIDEQGEIARNCSRFPTQRFFLFKSLGLNRLHSMRCISQPMLEWDHHNTQQVDQVIGAFFYIRRSLFTTLRGFDERFFVYFEEVDLSLRASQLGFSTMYLAEAQAFHAGGGASNQVKARRLFYSLRSRILYSFKHFSLVDVVGVLFTTLLVELVSRLFLVTVGRSWSGVKETLIAYGMLYHWLPRWAIKKWAC